jgi:hypothetical protein
VTAISTTLGEAHKKQEELQDEIVRLNSQVKQTVENLGRVGNVRQVAYFENRNFLKGDEVIP